MDNGQFFLSFVTSEDIQILVEEGMLISVLGNHSAGMVHSGSGVAGLSLSGIGLNYIVSECSESWIDLCSNVSSPASLVSSDSAIQLRASGQANTEYFSIKSAVCPSAVDWEELVDQNDDGLSCREGNSSSIAQGLVSKEDNGYALLLMSTVDELLHLDLCHLIGAAASVSLSVRSESDVDDD
ncbi:hypothetical protein Tco_1359939 [Tanacetum coccineum]